MSAFALVPRDLASPLAFSARKLPAETAQDDAYAGFDSALAQTANESALTPSPQQDVSASAPRKLASGGDSWRALESFSSQSGGEKAAGASSEKISDVPRTTAGRLIVNVAATRLASASDAPCPDATDGKSTASTEAADKELASAPRLKEPLKVDVSDDLGGTDVRIDAIMGAAPGSSKPMVSGLIRGASVSPTPLPATPAGVWPAASPVSTTAFDTPKTSLAKSAADRAVASSPVSKTEEASALTIAAVAQAALSPDRYLACLAASPPPINDKSTVPGGVASIPSDGDSAARLGAALANIGLRSQPPNAVEDAAPMMPVMETTSFVHVIAQKTWLQPVSPAFSPAFGPGLNRLAPPDRAAIEAPRGDAGKSLDPAETKIATNAAPAVAAPAARGDDTKAPVGGVLPPDGAGLLSAGDATPMSSAAARGTAAAAPDDSAPTKLAATPRRDLEITLEPTELGGVAVRMKSAGDRLEIAFVADRGETARIIADTSASLANQLHGAGLGLGGIDISASAVGAGLGGDALASYGGGAGKESESTPQRQDFSDRKGQDRNHETGEGASDSRFLGDRGLYL